MSKVYEYEFGYNEFIDAAINSKVVFPKQISDRRGKEKEEWMGTKSLKEAVNLAKHGWDVGIKQLKRDKVEVTGGINIRNSVTGAYPNIGAYLAGQPECMVNFTDETDRPLDRMTIYVRLSYSSRVEGGEAIEYCNKVIKIINRYNKNYDVGIMGIFNTKQKSNTEEFLKVKIKDYDQQLVLNNIAFAFHPSFFRRIWLRWLESKDYGDQSGYGHNYGDSSIIKIIIKSSTIKDQDIFLPSLNDYGVNWNKSDIIKLKDLVK